MYELPTSIFIGDEEFKIRNNGDYRVILDCFDALDDCELSQEERLIACLIIFYEDINSVDDIARFQDMGQAVEKMFKFFNCNQENPGANLNHKVIDWSQDFQLICSSINIIANKEIRLEPYLHWWTFMGYYTNIGEGPFATVVSIRSKMLKGKKLENYEKEFRKSNPQYFVWDAKSAEDKAMEEEILSMWNSEK